jgi:hypothetical protein
MVFGITYSYNGTVPSSTNYPGSDQTPMLANTGSISGILENDHIGFNSENGGTHEQISQAGVQTTSTFTGLVAPQSVVYPVLGTAGTNPQVQEVLQNAQCIVPLSAIRAFGCFDVTESPGDQGCHNSFNVTDNQVVNDGGGVYTITIATGAINTGSLLTGTPCVLLNINSRINSTSQFVLTWTWTAPGTFVISGAANFSPFEAYTISFVLLQF